MRLRERGRPRPKAEGRFGASRSGSGMRRRTSRRRLTREREVRRMAENLGAMKQKAATLRQQSVQAKREAAMRRPESCGRRPRQLERDLQGGLEKIERFKMESQIKDLSDDGRAGEEAGRRPEGARPSPNEARELEAAPSRIQAERDRRRTAIRSAHGGRTRREVKRLRREWTRSRGDGRASPDPCEPAGLPVFSLPSSARRERQGESTPAKNAAPP